MIETLKAKRRHMLITKEIAAKIPALYTNENKEKCEIMVYLKLFSPYSDYTFYVTEMNPETGVMFGLVVNQYGPELGYSDFSELESCNRNGLPLIERDCYFTPVTLQAIYDRHEN